MRPPEVCGYIGVSSATLRRMVLDSRFPAHVQLSTRAIGWPSSQVSAWLAARGGESPK
ncbi:helix-turn-helix transcriptional regulator [Pseudomonas sp. MH10out]